MIKLKDFKVVDWHDEEAKPNHRVLVYGLGENGILYEFSGGTWISLPIEEPVHYRNLQPANPNGRLNS